MRAVFMGTPDFAVPVLRSLLSGSCRLVGVYTPPDKPAKRGLDKSMSAVKRHAVAEGLPLFQPPSLRTPEAQRELEDLNPDLIVVAAYGKILPVPVLSLPRFGCLNIHPSLLPRHRGPSPVITAILQGDLVTGVSLILLDEGMDTGPILAQHETKIEAEETAPRLTSRLFQMGADLLSEVLSPWTAGEIHPRPQQADLATLTRKIEKADGEVVWQMEADDIGRRIRAFDPWPGVFTFWKGRLLKIVEGHPATSQGTGEPGQVVAIPGSPPGVGVVTGSGVIVLRQVQLEGRRAVTAEEFLRGYPDFLEARLPS